MARVADFRKAGEAGFSDMLDYAGLVADGVILNKSGALMAGWTVRGLDVANATDGERNTLAARVNSVIAGLGDGWMLHVDAVRKTSDRYPQARRSHFPDPVTRLIDAERREAFEAVGGHFETRTVLVLTWRPPAVDDRKVAKWFFDAPEAERTTALGTKILTAFQSRIARFERLLSNFVRLERLQTYDLPTPDGGSLRCCAFLEHLRQCISGEDRPVALPDTPAYLDYLLGGQYVSGLTPRIDGQLVGVVSVSGFPLETYPGILAHLDGLPQRYRWSTRFICLDEFTANKRMESRRKRWNGQVRSLFEQITGLNVRPPNMDAAAMVNDVDLALRENREGVVAYGYYTSQIVVFEPDVEALDRALKTIEQQMNRYGFSARIETLNANDAYLGSLPGNAFANVRKPLINTLNLAHLLPIQSVWAGREVAPCPFYPEGAPPLMIVGSDGRTPFRINLHVGDVGHTLIFGPTGSGKSTLLALIAAQFRRYAGAQVFAFDKGRSIAPLIRAAGGTYYTRGAGEGSDIPATAAEDAAASTTRGSVAFAPLSGLKTDSDSDRAWAEDWIASLLTLQNVDITPAHRIAVHDALEALLASPGVPSLSNFVSALQDKALKAALRYYTVDGAMGSLLDAESDGLADGPLIGFEIEELMGRGEAALVPVLLYLFHRIERRLTGAPSAILLDEAWVMLGHPVFRDRIREWLKVLRRRNCMVLLVTQSLSDATRSGIVDVLAESCPTKILLPNPEAWTPTSRPFYEAIGLNSVQIDIIARAVPKRDYYMVSPEGKRLFDMELGPRTLAFVGVSGAEDLTAFEAAFDPSDPDWVERWIASRTGEPDIPSRNIEGGRHAVAA